MLTDRSESVGSVKSEATEASSSAGGGSGGLMHSTEPAGTPFQALGEGNCQICNCQKVTVSHVTVHTAGTLRDATFTAI
jgi:hypothetical protein